MRKAQRGLTLTGLIMVLFVLVFLALCLLFRGRRHQDADRRDERHLDDERGHDAERRTEPEIPNRRQVERVERREGERRVARGT